LLEGYISIVVLIDRLSKGVVVEGLKDIKAKTIAK
jgi:hypothetical protein